MKKKIVCIFVMTLLITTAIQSIIAINISTTPNDPDFTEQWYLDNTGQTGGTSDADIDAPEAWDIETGDPDVVIAIVDTGVDYTHPDLADNIWTNVDEIPDNGIDDDENGYIDDVRGWDFFYNDNEPLDGFGHGTNLAGIAGAVSNNNVGIAGVCWNCKIMPVQIADETFRFSSSMWDGIIYAADNGADVISISFGSNNPNSEIRDNAINYAYDKGCVLVAAAGNGGSNTKYYPAAYNNVISVGGTDYKDNIMDVYIEVADEWAKSNWGDWVDIAAPGVNIYTTTPTYPVYINEEYDVSLNYYNMWAGTSLAAPIVAGVAALLLSRNNSLSQEEVKSLICENVDPYESERYIGTGRINAYKALSAINTPPNNPDIDGLTSGNTGEEQEFIISTTDPHGDDIFYLIDWGDDTGEEEFGPYPSGIEQTFYHTWNEKGEYTIRVKAQDIIGAESEWSELEVSMPKTKTMNKPFLTFLENHPHLFPLLRQILELKI